MSLYSYVGKDKVVSVSGLETIWREVLFDELFSTLEKK